MAEGECPEHQREYGGKEMKSLHIEQERSSESDPYHDLAVGVIRQAVNDYRSLRRKLDLSLPEEEKKTAEKEIMSIRRFFCSEWYMFLSGAENGSKILSILDMEVAGDG